MNSCHLNHSIRLLLIAELDKSYPATAWTQVFTDGSAENAKRNGRYGIYIRQPNKYPITIAIPGGDMCSNYRAEAQALLTATETVTQLETRPKKVVLLTDSLSVLQSLASGNPEDYTLRNLMQSLNSLTSRTTTHYKYNKSTANAEEEESRDKWLFVNLRYNKRILPLTLKPELHQNMACSSAAQYNLPSRTESYNVMLRLIKTIVLHWLLGLQVVTVGAYEVDYHWFNNL